MFSNDVQLNKTFTPRPHGGTPAIQNVRARRGSNPQPGVSAALPIELLARTKHSIPKYCFHKRKLSIRSHGAIDDRHSSNVSPVTAELAIGFSDGLARG